MGWRSPLYQRYALPLKSRVGLRLWACGLALAAVAALCTPPEIVFGVEALGCWVCITPPEIAFGVEAWCFGVWRMELKV